MLNINVGARVLVRSEWLKVTGLGQEEGQSAVYGYLTHRDGSVPAGSRRVLMWVPVAEVNGVRPLG